MSRERTGNHERAEMAFSRSLELLPETDIFRRSRSYKYRGDIAFSDLKYEKAIKLYSQSLSYHEIIINKINDIKEQERLIQKELNELKFELLNDRNYTRFTQYENKVEKRGQIKKQLKDESKDTEYQYRRLNSGEIRWKLAVLYEKTEQYDAALDYYRDAIKYNYQPHRAREKMKKIRLKIKDQY